MSNFTDQIRMSMSGARRTVPLPHDFVYALNSVGLTGSGVLEPHLDTGDVPTSLLQPTFPPPKPADPPPPNLEGMLGPELSGRAEKENRKYIPAHFPAFPPKHTWKSTPVYAKREIDPHAIREKAAKEGIEAEKSLRKLMESKKEGERVRKAARAQSKRSPIAVKRETLWKTALKEALEEELIDEIETLHEAHERAERDVADPLDEDLIAEDRAREEMAERAKNDEWNKAQAKWDADEAKAAKAREPFNQRLTREAWEKQWAQRNTPEQRMERRIQQRVTVNYGRKFWRHNARG